MTTPASAALARARTRVQTVIADIDALTMQPDALAMVTVARLLVDHANLEIAARVAGITTDQAEPPAAESEQTG